MAIGRCRLWIRAGEGYEKNDESGGGVFGASVAVACVSVFFVGLASAQDSVVFSDTFGSGSTINSGNAPTANSTSYDTASSAGKPYTDSVAAGDLNLSLEKTSAAGIEAQALFTTTPVALQSVGTYIDFQLVFNDTSNLLPGTSAQLYMGLFNSGGVAPLTDHSDSTSFTGGGVQNWLGYTGMVATNGGKSEIYTRPAQTSGNEQDLLGNGNSSGFAYKNPQGVILNGASVTSSAALTKGITDTNDLRIWISASGVLTITNTLSNGRGILSQAFGTAGGATNLTSTFDGLAFGWYSNGADVPSAIDVDSITITTNIPEPSTLALLAAGLDLTIGLVRRPRH